MNNSKKETTKKIIDDKIIDILIESELPSLTKEEILEFIKNKKLNGQ
jgi:hypothetical protein